MNLKTLGLSGVTTHMNTVLEFPRCGVVLVTGRNGQGKSTLADAVALACWGEVPRGTPLWAGESGTVTLETYEGLTVTRVKTPKRIELAWSVVGQERVTHESPTKAQEALVRVRGPYEVWRRSSLFLTQDVALFSLATDAVRKRYLEELLGLDAFDRGLAGCRSELKGCGVVHANATRECDRMRVDLVNQEARLADVTVSLVKLPPAGAAVGDQPEIERLARMVLGLAKEANALRKRAEAARRAGWETRARMQDLEQKLVKLSGSVCPTCEQPVPEALREGIRAGLAEAKEKASEQAKAGAGEVVELEDLVAESDEERDRLTQRQHVLVGEQGAAAERTKQRADLEQKTKEIGPALEKLRVALAKHEAEHARAAEALAVLEAVEQVLGFQGVRAQLLDGALRGLEQVANYRLGQIARPGLQLQLRSSTDLKGGGTNDKISLEVLGAGGGHGYKASSGGERRRIDVALLFAHGALAQGAYGQGDGTLYFDEVFDALDEEGTDAVAEVLRELAETRCVVVITHNGALGQRLPGARRWTVEGGTVRC